jgi:superfamily II DNA/RNA helicase
MKIFISKKAGTIFKNNFEIKSIFMNKFYLIRNNLFCENLNDKNTLNEPNSLTNKQIKLNRYAQFNKIEYDPSLEKLDQMRKYNPIVDRAMKMEENALSFKEFKFIPEIYHVLDSLKFYAPTSIQSVAIPKIMEKKHVLLTSQTGTGKTLAYVLPIIHELKMQEKVLKRRLTTEKRPRMLILLSSRELAQQVEEVIKLFVYDVPLVVESFYVGKNFNTEKEACKRGMDILISTPERFKNHWSKNNVFISKLTHVVIDEMDTLMDAGYDEFIKNFADNFLNKNQEDDEDKNIQHLPESVNSLNKPNMRQLVFASTTLTTSIQEYLDNIFSHRTDFVKIIDKSTNHNLSNVKHEFMHVTDYNKYPTLIKMLTDNVKIFKENMSVIIFCNGIACARKTELMLSENNFSTACLHGDIPPIRRKFELDKFKSRRAKVLVCTDLIARGLDFPFVYLVVNFDFPKTVSDYLHRAGRTGRGGRKGVVVSFYRSFNLPVIEKIKKAHQLNLPLDIQHSMYSLRKTLISDKVSSIKAKLTPGIREKTIIRKPETEKATIIRLKRRKEAFENYKKKSLNDRNKIIMKMNNRNRKKLHTKSRMNYQKIKLRKKIYN